MVGSIPVLPALFARLLLRQALEDLERLSSAHSSSSLSIN